MDDYRYILYPILIFIFIALSAFFSLVETAYSCVNKYRIRALADDGNKSAKLVEKIIDRFNISLSVVLIGNNICSVVLSFVSTFLFVQLLPLEEGIASIISSIIITIIVYIFGETLPKHIGKKLPNKIVLKTAYPLVFFIIILLPLSLILVGLSSILNLLFKNKSEANLTEEDFNSVIEKNEEQGALEENETDIIQASFDFNDTAVDKVFTPVSEMFTINMTNMTMDKLASIVANTNYSRIPLYYSDKNKIIGILIVKNFLAKYLEDKHLDLRKIIQKPYIISPSIKIDDLIDGFRTKHTQIALVYKDKNLIGMVTMDDVLEELIGPINENDLGVRV